MGVFEMVVAIVTVSIIGSVIKEALKARRKGEHKANDALEQRLQALEQRLATVEQILTDPKRDLKDQINSL